MLPENVGKYVLSPCSVLTNSLYWREAIEKMPAGVKMPAG